MIGWSSAPALQAVSLPISWQHSAMNRYSSSIVGLMALVYGIIDGGEHGFGRTQAWGSIVPIR